MNVDLLRLACLWVVAENNLPVNTVVRAFLLLDGPRAHQAQRPPLELNLVLLGRDVRPVGRDGFADGDDLDLVAAGVAQPVLRRKPAKGGSSPLDELQDTDSTRRIGILNAACSGRGAPLPPHLVVGS